ncbi:dioxygenase family protein [Halomonas sp. KO116]|uniref:dioxygenase family protein n=1 Tax=Halomonas sp. KO116 TaxID=1504981 RepID=UPI003FA60446
MLKSLGRHGERPAHIHYFVSAPGHQHLTTQINLAGDPYTYDDFAFATREELVVPAERIEDPAEIAKRDLDGPFSHVVFDVALAPVEAPSCRCVTPARGPKKTTRIWPASSPVPPRYNPHALSKAGLPLGPPEQDITARHNKYEERDHDHAA